MREEFSLRSVECQKINPLAYFSILDGGCLHFDYVFHYIFQNNSLLLEKFHDIIAWRTLVKMKSKNKENVPFQLNYSCGSGIHFSIRT